MASTGELAAELSRYGVLDGATEPARPSPGSGTGAGSAPAAGRSRRRWLPISLLLTVVLAACAVAVVLLSSSGGGTGAAAIATATPTASMSTAPLPTAPGTPSASTSVTPTASASSSSPATVTSTATPVSISGPLRSFDVTAGGVSAVDFQGAPGALTVVGTNAGQVTLTGQLSETVGAPTVTTSRSADGTLELTVTCANSCTETLQLAVPRQAAMTLQLPGGSVELTGLAGPLSISAVGVNVTASGLSSPSLTAAVTNGQLDAAFTAPPRQVSATLTSSQATLRLPASVTYRVINDIGSGSVSAAVPQSAAATHTVTATIHSGELTLLPS